MSRYPTLSSGSKAGVEDKYDAHEDTYEAELLRRYRLLVRDRVGHKQEPLPDIKNIRVSPLRRNITEKMISRNLIPGWPDYSDGSECTMSLGTIRIP